MALKWAKIFRFYHNIKSGIKNIRNKPNRSGRVVYSAVLLWHGRSWVWAPNLHQCLWRHLQVCDQKGSSAMLTFIQMAGVAPEVNAEESVVHRWGSMQVRESTLALKPKACITRSPNRGTSGPTKRTCVLQKFWKRKKKSETIHCIYLRFFASWITCKVSQQ